MKKALAYRLSVLVLAIKSANFVTNGDLTVKKLSLLVGCLGESS